MSKNFLFRCLATMLAVCSLVAVEAAPRNVQQALEIASTFRSQAGMKKAPSMAQPSVAYVEKAGNLDCFYVINYGADNGFAIVTADDRLPEVLGYSSTGDFNGKNLPVNVQAWLDEYKAQIEWALENLPDEVYEAPARKADRASVAPLCKTYWNQDAPFNDLCPMDGSSRSVTGCVATAMAQVMKAHEWPQAAATGSRNGIDFSEYIFDWDNMLDDYSNGYTAEQAEAVARLMRNCGASIDMNYSATASGTQTLFVPQALLEYFDYSKDMRWYFRCGFSPSQWDDMVYADLAQGNPVIYQGIADGGGHAFVCDGYSYSDYFHINWGWGGYCDGYFRLTALNPDGQGIGGFAGGYNSSQGAGFGIKPQTTATDADIQKSDLMDIMGSTFQVYGSSSLSLSFSALMVQGYRNVEVLSAGARLTSVATDTEAGIATGSLSGIIENIYAYASTVNLSLPELEDGRYYLTPIWKNTDEEWLDVMQPYNLAKRYILVKSGDTLSIETEELPQFESKIIIVDNRQPSEQHTAGWWDILTACNVNPDADSTTTSIYLKVNDSDLQYVTSVAPMGGMTESFTVKMSDKIREAGGATSGTYYFADGNGEPISDIYEYNMVEAVEVVPVSENLTITPIYITSNMQNNGNKHTLTYRAVNNSDQEVDIYFTLVVTGQTADGKEISFKLENYELPLNANADVTFNLPLTGYVELPVGDILVRLLPSTDGNLTSMSPIAEPIYTVNMGWQRQDGDTYTQLINNTEAQGFNMDYTAEEAVIPANVRGYYYQNTPDFYDFDSNSISVALKRIIPASMLNTGSVTVTYEGQTDIGAGDFYVADNLQKLVMKSATPNFISAFAWEGGKDAGIEAEFPDGLLNKYMHSSNWAKMIDVPSLNLDIPYSIASELDLERDASGDIYNPYYVQDGTLSITMPADAVACLAESGEAALYHEGETANLSAAKADGDTFRIYPIGLCSVAMDPETISADDTDGTKAITAKLTAFDKTLTPMEGGEFQFNWTSSDETVATVDANGIVTIIKGGDCVITATLDGFDSIYGNCTLDIATRVEMLTDDDLCGEVVTIGGITLMQNATAADVRALPAGIYIVNGNKVSIR